MIETQTIIPAQPGWFLVYADPEKKTTYVGEQIIFWVVEGRDDLYAVSTSGIERGWVNGYLRPDGAIETGGQVFKSWNEYLKDWDFTEEVV